MEICKDCLCPSFSTFLVEEDGKWVHICGECLGKREAKRISAALETVKHPSDFKTWDKGDMSDAFWIHLGRYKKKPNRKSLGVIRMAFGWACHADHGLSSSFYHALKWCGINLYDEGKRKDLPETDEEA